MNLYLIYIKLNMYLQMMNYMQIVTENQTMNANKAERTMNDKKIIY